MALLLLLFAGFTSNSLASDFARDIRPILRRACVECHGADKHEAGLRLDRHDAAVRGGDSGRALIAGKPGESELLRRVSLPRGHDEAMPPRGKGLTTREIKLLRDWIASGAEWPENAESATHWAYLKPVRPEVPDLKSQIQSRSHAPRGNAAVDAPRLLGDQSLAISTIERDAERRDRRSHAERGNEIEIRNAIDAFIAERLLREGLMPSPEADRATLARRLSFDLIGLPPSPAEVEAFVRDSDPDAYKKLVDRLLRSEEFGVKWARPWLDLARYADSHGFQRDDLRDLWAYRDWVVNALNADMPFDRFTIEQIAGDLLPNPTQEQLVATGFHRCSPTNVEAGTDPEESRINQVIDRVNTTGAVWLGTTLECAQCHNHKYDPFTQRDYYRLLAYFNNTEAEAERANPKVPGSIKFLGPSLPLTDAGKKSGSSLVMKELPQPRRSSMFIRGEYTQPGEPVTPGTPAVLPSAGDGPPNRLTLARWLVSPDNPLTARVTVNRWWAEIFGQGLVTTVEDFGIKGESPTHPELLDWLAVEFIEGSRTRGSRTRESSDRSLTTSATQRWSMKHILKLIVMSSTYRQSSRVTPELFTRDDRNRLYARGSRFRLDAEAIRDNALSISGLLSLNKGGPSIRPPQPDGLWRKVGGEQYKYDVSPGEQQYRRGLYVVLKRGSPYPSFVNFDASSRMACVVKRSRSNTPLQALTLLNDPVFVEAARSFARRVITELPQGDVESRIEFAFRIALSRSPRANELAVLRDLYDQQLRRHEADELAAWYAVAAALLNLDETITKG